MYEFQGIHFGLTEVTVEADSLRGALDQMGQLYNLHKDALFLEAHVEFFYDTQPEVVPRSRDDEEGFQYRGFECLRTGCNITFKETEEDSGIYPGRYRAYRNGDDNPKLYDPQRGPEEILGKVSTDTPFVQRFQVDVGQSGNRQSAPPRGKQAPSSGSAANPSGNPEASSTRQNGHESERLYDQSSRSEPTKEEAASALVAKAQEHPDDTLASNAEVNGTTLDQKLEGFAEYCGRSESYVGRVTGALQLQDLSQVAVGQVRTVVHMLLDEGALQENEEFEPDDQLPF